MKTILLFVLAVVTLSLGAKADLLYSQNFDAAGADVFGQVGADTSTNLSSVPELAGWTVVGAGSTLSTVQVFTGTDQYPAQGYAILTSGDGTDYNLSVGDSNNTNNDSISYLYTAPLTGGTISGITGSFDFEASDAVGSSYSAELKQGLSYSVDGGSAVSLPDTTPSVSFSAYTTPDTVLTDGTMDALGLSVRNITFSLTGVTLNPGDTVNFAFTNNAPGGQYKHVVYGIDNFSINGTVTGAAVPEPGTLATVGLGGLTMLMLRRRRS